MVPALIVPSTGRPDWEIEIHDCSVGRPNPTVVAVRQSGRMLVEARKVLMDSISR